MGDGSAEIVGTGATATEFTDALASAPSNSISAGGRSTAGSGVGAVNSGKPDSTTRDSRFSICKLRMYRRPVWVDKRDRRSRAVRRS
jgi:hypothetical protein